MSINETYTVHYNGDFSGDIWIDDPLRGGTIVIPFYVLKFIVAEYIRDTKIEQLEEASPQEILGGK